VQALTGALIDTYRGVPLHEPGRVFADLAVAIADGADAISGIAVREDRQELFGSVASMPTTWRVLDRIDAGHLGAVRLARAAREAAMAAGAGPDIAVSTWPWRSCQRRPSRDDPKPFLWKATANDIVEKVRRGRVALTHKTNTKTNR